MQIYDLSVLMREGMDIYPGDPQMEMTQTARIKVEGCDIQRISFGSHTGTHLDFPRHFIVEGATAESYSPERFLGSASILDARESIAQDQQIDLNRMKLDAIQPGDFVLVYTGWDRRRGHAAFYQDLPYFTAEFAALLEDKKVRLLGTDMPTVLTVPELHDPSRTYGNVFPEATIAHIELLSRDILILEGLVGLEPLVGRRLGFSCLPLRLQGANGCPVRAIAWE